MSSDFLSIPMPIADCRELSDSDRVFYARLTGLTIKYGCCIAGNSYLADKFNISQRVVSRRIATLAKHGFIRVEETKTKDGTKRKIWLYHAIGMVAQKLNKEPKLKPEKKKASKATPVPDEFVIDDELRGWASGQQIMVDLQTETEQWQDYHRAKGSLQKDWRASWRTWMRNSKKFGGRNVNSNNAGTAPASYYDQLTENAWEM